jgi:transposase-like protein
MHHSAIVLFRIGIDDSDARPGAARGVSFLAPWRGSVARKAGRRRYTAAEKKNILNTAIKENLTGAQVQKRFGIAQLTFYRWRGPVRGKRAAGGTGRGPGRPPGSGANLDSIRSEVRAGIQKVLPEVIRQEVQSYLAAILGRAPGKRRGRKPGPKPGRKRGRPAKS